jgi:hypothetical protein
MSWQKCIFACVVCLCISCVCCCALSHGFNGYITQTSLGLLGGALALAGVKRPTSKSVTGLFRRR